MPPGTRYVPSHAASLIPIILTRRCRLSPEFECSAQGIKMQVRTMISAGRLKIWVFKLVITGVPQFLNTVEVHQIYTREFLRWLK